MASARSRAQGRDSLTPTSALLGLCPCRARQEPRGSGKDSRLHPPCHHAAGANVSIPGVPVAPAAVTCDTQGWILCSFRGLLLCPCPAPGRGPQQAATVVSCLCFQLTSSPWNPPRTGHSTPAQSGPPSLSGLIWSAPAMLASSFLSASGPLHQPLSHHIIIRSPPLTTAPKTASPPPIFQMRTSRLGEPRGTQSPAGCVWLPASVIRRSP